MLKNLLKKELALCLHPAALMMLPLSGLLLVPNYPYPVSFFYLTLGFFFICQGGRENGDVIYTLTLPVAKKDVATARFLLVVLLELAELALCAVFLLLREKLAPGPNAAGMDANLALIGEGFLFFALYHVIFFPGYYRDVNRVGVNFVKASAVSFLFIAVDIVLCYTVPLFRDRLDTPLWQHTGEKLVFTLICALLYALLTFLALRMSQKRLEKQDIR